MREAPTPVHAADPVALLRGLRRRGDEAQFTQVIAALAIAEPEFGRRFVGTLLDAARLGQPEKVAELEPIPDQLRCRAEAVLRDKKDPLGRVDLRFEDGSDFTLFVENKFHSGYGDEQLERYLVALEALPPEQTRTGLIAVTRDIHGYGEPGPETPRWLGSVRWAKLLPELRELPLPEPLRSEWRLLLELMQADGDLGTTTPDTNAIECWGAYARGREELENLLKEIRDGAFGALRDAMAAQYPDRNPAELADYHTFGKRGKVAVKHELTRTWMGFRIPADEREDPGLIVQFSNYYRVPHFTVQAQPFDAEELLRDGNAHFRDAARRLNNVAGFAHDRSYWAHVHDADEWLYAPDVPDVLGRFAASDIKAIVGSGIFDLDVSDSRARRLGLRRSRRMPEESSEQ